MREIKFRAWNTSTTKMYPLTQITFPGGGSWSVEKGCGVSMEFQPHVTLMQYTGLKDKNGKEIYEGDVLRMKAFNPELNIVRFNRGGFCIEPILEAPLEASYWPDIKYAEDDGSEIIGNIYENPELLN